ncbi:hypothetical protein DBV39_01705 [Orrella marina]|uniref:Uncharacterized protein n=1 Tax=Orrella marina TaxID=2163011 RepID=A0A2R4XFR6_9BURK|nr:hypothetical protein DBV39_01705 [Orrella marina]
MVRPAWAHPCGCKSRCELVTVSKVKSNCAKSLNLKKAVSPSPAVSDRLVEHQSGVQFSGIRTSAGCSIGRHP